MTDDEQREIRFAMACCHGMTTTLGRTPDLLPECAQGFHEQALAVLAEMESHAAAWASAHSAGESDLALLDQAAQTHLQAIPLIREGVRMHCKTGGLSGQRLIQRGAEMVETTREPLRLTYHILLSRREAPVAVVPPGVGMRRRLAVAIPLISAVSIATALFLYHWVGALAF